MAIVLAASILFVAIAYHDRINPRAGELVYLGCNGGYIPVNSLRGVAATPCISGPAFRLSNDYTTLGISLMVLGAVIGVVVTEIAKGLKPRKSRKS